MSEHKIKGASLTVWSNAAREFGNTSLADELSEDKVANLRMLAELGLPRYKHITLPAVDFMKDPAKAFQELDLEEYFVVAAPHDPTKIRYRNVGLDKPGSVAYIDSVMAGENPAEYDVVLQEYYENEFAGNLLVNDDGSIVIELVDGIHNLLTSGFVTPPYQVRRDQFSEGIKYSFENPELRQAVWQTLQSLPKDPQAPDSDSFRAFNPLGGYYEFILTRKNGASLQPIFLEYIDRPLFKTTGSFELPPTI